MRLTGWLAGRTASRIMHCVPAKCDCPAGPLSARLISTAQCERCYQESPAERVSGGRASIQDGRLVGHSVTQPGDWKEASEALHLESV